jgi:hypothetical protein
MAETCASCDQLRAQLAEAQAYIANDQVALQDLLTERDQLRAQLAALAQAAKRVAQILKEYCTYATEPDEGVGLAGRMLSDVLAVPDVAALVRRQQQVAKVIDLYERHVHSDVPFQELWEALEALAALDAGRTEPSDGDR